VTNALISRRSMILAGLGPLASTCALASSSDLQKITCSPSDESISCFEPFDFLSDGVSHRVYAAGSGPPVILLHELPGMTPSDIRVAKLLMCDGYTVVMPLMFGSPGDDRFLHYLNTVCGKDQFDCSGTRTPPAARWIRGLCTSVRKKWDAGLGMGIIGMCLTGEFPLTLMSNESIAAVVTCQPTNPFNLLTLVHLGPKAKLGITQSDLEDAQKNSKIPFLGVRYDGDPFCPGKRFDLLTRLFPKRFYRLDLAGHGHSSLGNNFCDVAFEEVRLYLGTQLKGTSPIPGKKFPERSQCDAIGPKPVSGHCNTPSIICPAKP
jgi:dienelactone hydrolase